ncbi:MAG: bacillithiol biosynthesis deacetylase BshB1 [Candidatus Krumholzibacteriia bacterium]
MTSEAPACDLLVVSPHTDDAEIGLGGTLALLAGRGRRVWVADLTRGELGSNATVDERWAEAAAASAVLGLAGRVQLELPDGFLDPHDRQQTAAVAALLRSLRPRWLVTAPDPVRHPDHVAAPVLVARAAFLAGLVAWPTPLPDHRAWAEGAPLPAPADAWRPEAVFGVCPDGGQPALLVDVGAVWERKAAALACFASQFDRTAGRRPTAINDASFLARIEQRARVWGRRAGVELAEALCGEAVPVLTDLPTERWR